LSAIISCFVVEPKSNQFKPGCFYFFHAVILKFFPGVFHMNNSLITVPLAEACYERKMNPLNLCLQDISYEKRPRGFER
jgi:hypothetical protein